MLFRPVEVFLRALFGCAALLAWLKLSIFVALPFTPLLAALALGPDPVGSTSRLDFVVHVARGAWSVLKAVFYAAGCACDVGCFFF